MGSEVVEELALEGGDRELALPGGGVEMEFCGPWVLDDLRLEPRLGVLGLVVLGVLLEVAEAARRLDLLGDRGARGALELRQRGAQRLEVSRGHLVVEIVHWRRT